MGKKEREKGDFIMKENDAHENIFQFLLRNKVTGWIHIEILFILLKEEKSLQKGGCKS